MCTGRNFSVKTFVIPIILLFFISYCFTRQCPFKLGWVPAENTLATWCEEPVHWKRPWCWEWLRAGGEGSNRGWDVGWHHQLNGHEFEQILGDSKRTGKPGVLPFMGSQRVRPDLATEQQQLAESGKVSFFYSIVISTLRA